MKRNTNRRAPESPSEKLRRERREKAAADGRMARELARQGKRAPWSLLQKADARDRD